MNDAVTTSGANRLTPDEIAAALVVAQEIFRQARPLIMAHAGKVTGYRDKQDGSPVTDIDIEVEHRITTALAARLPHIPVYGEETGYQDDATSGTFWLIDPIDGTKSFIANEPAFSTMGVLIQDDEAVGSVIYNLVQDDMYVAQKGRGAYKNGVRLDLQQIPLPTVASCKGRFIKPLDRLLQPLGVTCQIRSSGAGSSFALIADGTLAARFDLPGRGYTHDYAPGALLVREAGGVVVPVEDDVYRYTTRSLVTCHPALAETIRAHVAEIRKLERELAEET